ncbi:hypothetical protein K2173_013533 [Erythroxylum novogranatense]|uniref:Uncharacterized protein n=1 Tax=Erythroxylum novogranatense TaxID=1862640 RepID=A0AAV8TJS9_9ROSI|nr:hypothetical protein K2173_013533 [Erythroxylum novogranatense]
MVVTKTPSPTKIRAAAAGVAEVLKDLHKKKKAQVDRGKRGDVACLLETRVKRANVARILSAWFPGWNFLCNYDYVVNGRIWILWKPGVQIQPIAKSDQSITCSFSSGLQSGHFTAVYGSNDVGDFNIIAAASESSGYQFSNQLLNDMDDFKDWMCAGKLDRVLVSDDWFGTYGCSVEASWKLPVEGSSMMRLKVVLRELNKECYADISQRVVDKRKELDDLQLQVMMPNVDMAVVEHTVKVYKEYRELLLAEESFYKQKSGVQCVKEGDANTKFYHCSVKSKLCKSQIRMLNTEQGDFVDTKQGLADVAVGYFSKLLGEKDSNVVVPDVSLLKDLLLGAIGEAEQQLLVKELNPSKTEVFSSGVPVDELEVIHDATGFALGQLPVRYLGVPLVSKRLTERDCGPLIDNVRKRVSG